MHSGMKKYLLISLLILPGLFTNAQVVKDNKEKASNNAKQALLLEEKEKYDDAILLLTEAIKFDPENINYPYELALAWYSKGNYKAAIQLLEALVNRKDVMGTVFQVLGNAYDKMGDREKAIVIYEKGLVKFPNSAELHLELGNMDLIKKQYDKAIAHYEKGIAINPGFASNYFWAAKLFCNSEDPVWGMIYGEIFLNLERNSSRTDDISKLLSDTYKKCIRFPKDSTFSVSFSKRLVVSPNTIDVSELGKKEAPFTKAVYEPLHMLALLNESTNDIPTLCRVRTYFIQSYFSNSYYLKYPNPLFDFQYRVWKAGYMDAYSHWVLYKGDELGNNQWIKANSKQWDDFMKWFKKNEMKLDTKYKFLRTTAAQ